MTVTEGAAVVALALALLLLPPLRAVVGREGALGAGGAAAAADEAVEDVDAVERHMSQRAVSL